MANLVIGTKARQSQDDEPSLDNKGSWQTVRPNVATKLTYANRMTLAFALTAVMTVLILIAVLSVVWEGQFQRYTRQNMERLAVTTAQTIAQQYQFTNNWEDVHFNSVTEQAGLTGDVAVQVVNNRGQVVFDDTLSMQANENADQHRRRELMDNTPPSSASVVVAPIVTQYGRHLGEVRVWSTGSDSLLTKTDAAFRVNSYGAILMAAAIAIVLASVVGVVVSRSLTKPIKRITDTAAKIRNGDLSARTGLNGDDEIGQLGLTFDDMANSVERDLKMEKRLTSDVAHELRTPLMAMLATVEGMQDGILPADDEHLAIVDAEVKRLSRLVDAMLKLSRMENGSVTYDPVPTEMVSMISSLVTSQEPLFNKKDLRLKFKNATNSRECYAEVDRDMINQAIINLMSNAMRYTPEGGWVVVGVSQDKNDVLISVEDTGIGIAKEDLAKVFNRFWRSDASRVRETGGLGVGMSLTKEIIDYHSGYISIDSNVGKGTCFTLHIPRTQPHGRGNAEEE